MNRTAHVSGRARNDCLRGTHYSGTTSKKSMAHSAFTVPEQKLCYPIVTYTSLPDKDKQDINAKPRRKSSCFWRHVATESNRGLLDSLQGSSDLPLGLITCRCR